MQFLGKLMIIKKKFKKKYQTISLNNIHKYQISDFLEIKTPFEIKSKSQYVLDKNTFIKSTNLKLFQQILNKISQ